jgi:prepilin-type N-terminal cleavage/methylation domain-containing protein
MRNESGFSLLEVMVSTAIMLVVTAGIFSVLNPSNGAYSQEPEVADMQQRLRVGTDTLYKDLVMAGAGAYNGKMSGSLAYFFAPILPYRNGSANDDPPGTFKSNVITLMYVPATMSQTSLASKGPAQQSSEMAVNGEPGCPPGDPLCGFQDGMQCLIYDATGNYDTFTVTNVQDNPMHIQHNSDKFTYTNYKEDGSTKVVQLQSHTYYLKADAPTQTYQLMHYDGGLGPDVPVVDNVVGLNFDYYGDPQPPQMLDPVKLTTTYGPQPPPLTTTYSAYPNGENCVIQVVAGQQTSRLPVLGAGGNALAKLDATNLTDGPWCPDANNPNRWDADLLRIRKILVTIRVQAAVASLRGPASALFSVGGTSRKSTAWVPDQEIRFQVTPRNMNLGR